MSILRVALPARSQNDATQPGSVWSLEKGGDKLLEGCAKTSGSMVQCCSAQRKLDKRHLIDPDIMRDLVIGLADGLTVPFALTAGLSALGSTHLVVTGGVAELISGAFSMGIGGFLAAQADRSQFLYLNRTTRSRLERACQSELRRETHEILEKVGIQPVADALIRVEQETTVLAPQSSVREFMTGRVGDSPGLSTFLVRFGEGMEETTRLRMFTSGIGYLLGGIVPLLPYIIIKGSVLVALWWSIGVTAVVLLTFGGLKAYYTGAGQTFLGVAYGATSTLAIGGAAAAASYGVVKALNR